VKEAAFDIVQFQIDGSRVLDLFAGSGALGLEAASRGAAHVTLVDSATSAVRVMNRNVRALNMSEFVTVVKADAARFVASYSGQPFDLVFLDPPFDSDLLARALALALPLASLTIAWK
jgi:16S rRNA (guanine(966)-N(2))-methyltransferase RsmD